MSNTKIKNYPTAVEDDLKALSKELQETQFNGKWTLRTIAKLANLSVNSVKSILEGQTANIASYDMVARAMNTTLFDIAVKIRSAAKTSQKESAKVDSTVSTNTF